MILTSFDFDTLKDSKPKQSKLPSPPQSDRRGMGPVKTACIFLNVVTQERSPAEIAAEIWRKLKSPDMLIVWMINQKMHRFAVEAAKWYDHRANS